MSIKQSQNLKTEMIGKTVSHYKILEQIGQGGMGVVYKAEDTRLERTVALKFLLPHALGSEEEKARFVREAQAAAALEHPNICTVYEIDEVPIFLDPFSKESREQIFIAMAYIAGKSLKEMIESGPLKLEEVPNIAIQAAEGLQQAHAKGIFHRDIKSANIMVTSKGRVKITDFGLAQITGKTKITKTGLTMGTLAYMSPEQGSGKAVDQRTDIWSLGVVMYEMITGQLPFKGDYEPAVVYSILCEDPEPMMNLRSNVPVELERIVKKALQKDRNERYQHIGEMLTDLKILRKALAHGSRKEWLIKTMRKRERSYLHAGVVSLVVVMIVGALYFFTGRDQTINSLAVLPFTNLSTDPNAEYLSDGITESIITRVSQLSTLKVIAFSSTMRYKAQEIDPQAVGHELGARAILLGRLLQRDNDLLISAELVDARDNRQIWGEHYNRKPAGIFAVQEEISKEISEKLQLRLTGEEKKRLIKRHTDNTEAYQAYLKGRYFWNKRTPREIKKGIEYFQQAIAEDPSYAPAYAGLADAYAALGSIEYGGLPPGEAIPKAEAAALKALEIDETLAEARTTLANIRFTYEWDWPGAEREFKRVIELSPSYAMARHWYAHYLAAMGRFDEALAEEKQAQELDPLSLIINTQVGMIFYYGRRYDQALEQYKKTLELDPQFVQAHLALGLAYEQQMRFKEAIAEFLTAFNLSGGNPTAAALLGHAYAVSDERSEAIKILDSFQEPANRRLISPIHLALIYLGLGEKDQAFEWLERACAERWNYLVYLKVEPLADDLRSDPRFKALMKKIELRP